LDEYTGEFCDVTPYSSDYQPLTNIPIVNASTAYTDDATGETILLRFNQILWYGSRLNMSLINPNQIRHNGITVSDDPTDKTRAFGITGGVDFHVAFQILGTTVYFETRVPTSWEYENCRLLELTCDTPWNPGEVNISAASATSPKLTIEQVTYQNVCALDRIPRCGCDQTGKSTDVMKIIRGANIKLRIAEKGRGITQNHRAETEIREVKTKWKTRMRSNQVPARLWDFGLVYIAEIQSILARGVDKRPGLEKLTGETIDISEWLDFDFYDRVWFWDQKKMDMTDEQARIG
jgi:hypothetical protein